MPDFSSYLDYWPNPTFTALGLEQGYIIANHIVTASDVLKIFSSMEPFELAIAINNSILFHKLDKIYDFPRPFLLCKTRYDDANDRMLYFLLENEELYPFSYEWTDGGLSFDFRGLVFQESIIREIEYSAFNLDFNLKPKADTPAPYARLPFLKEQFPPEGPEKCIATLMRQVVESQTTAKPKASAKNNLERANDVRQNNAGERWKKQFSSGIAATLFCMEEYRKTGKPVTRKEYTAALNADGHAPLMVEAEGFFRNLLPKEMLHRGD